MLTNRTLTMRGLPAVLVVVATLALAAVGLITVLRWLA